MRRTIALALAYAGTIVAANYAVANFGPIPVGFGLVAPAGVLFAGLAFTIRDLLHDAAGWRVTVAAIVVGCAVSLATGGPVEKIAYAGGAAFLLSELLDMAIYAPLRERRWLVAVALSNLAGLLIDSALFLWLAFGSMAFLPGQVWGKLAMTGVAVAVLAVVRTRRRARQRAFEIELFGPEFHGTLTNTYLD